MLSERLRSRVRQVVAVLSGAGLVLVGAAGPVRLAAAQPAQGGTITYVNSEPANINPRMKPEAIAAQTDQFITRGLTDLDVQGNWVPKLAAELPTIDNGGVSPDGLTVAWHLRPGLRWSDGTPLTSDDLRFTIEVCGDPTSGCARSEGMDLIGSVETPDDQTLVVHYNQLYLNYLSQFRDGVLPRHSPDVGPVQDFAHWQWSRTQNPSTGPFMVQEWVAGDHITLARNPYFYEAGKPYLDSVNIIFRSDIEVARQTVLSGSADISPWLLEPAPTQLQELVNRGFQIGSGSTGYVNRIQLNLWNPKNLAEPHPILGDVNVRKAIFSGVDINKITYNWAIPGVYTPQRFSHWYDLYPWIGCNIPQLPHNVDAANRMLTDAGWLPGSDGIRAKNGVRMRLRVGTYTGQGQEDNEVVLLDELKKLGIDAYPVNADPTIMYSSWTDGSFMYRGDFDVLYWDTGPGMPDPQVKSLSLYSSKYIPSESRPNGQNMSRINDPEIDQWLEQAGSTIDQNARRAAYCKVADKVLNTWVTEQFNGIIPNFQFSQPKVKGWTDNELYTPFGQDAENWYLAQ